MPEFKPVDNLPDDIDGSVDIEQDDTNKNPARAKKCSRHSQNGQQDEQDRPISFRKRLDSHNLGIVATIRTLLVFPMQSAYCKQYIRSKIERMMTR